MKSFIKLNEEFDFASLQTDVLNVYEKIKKDAVDNEYKNLANRNISLTVSEENSDDWTDGIAGKTFINKTQSDNSVNLKTQLTRESNEMVNEKLYIHPINQIKDTYLETLIKSYKDVYRWRLSILPPRTTLSIHVDGSPLMYTLQGGSAVMDWRLHFPIRTNNRCFLVHWPSNFGTPSDKGEEVKLQMANFKSGNAYLLNTQQMHCATNYSNTERVHLIASLSSETIRKFSV